MKTIITKGEFAKLKGRAPSAISNWIADGRITAAALVGSGVRARIWVEQAERDLARNLDPSQQIAQDRPVSMAAPAGSVAPEAPAAPLPAPAEDEDLRRRRRADAESAEHQAELLRMKREREAGRWVEAADAQKRFSAELVKFVTEVETWAAQKLARTLAEKHGLDWRTLSADVRASWREFRGEKADAAEAARRSRDGRGDDDGDGAPAALL
ncbi:hypothetical protein [Xanthobacter aminoxidans]|uniref:hypothetical protein n=1 Tax=Xanthobacter aminoxidans TaxID=186280 RepID=UPI0037290A70